MTDPDLADQPYGTNKNSTLSSNRFKSILDVVFLWTEAATNRLMNKRKSYLVASQKWQQHQQQTVLVCCWLHACIVSNVVGGQWSNVEPAIEEKEELVVFAYQVHRLQQKQTRLSLHSTLVRKRTTAGNRYVNGLWDHQAAFTIPISQSAEFGARGKCWGWNRSLE